MAQIRKAVLVGHCGPDAAMLRSVVTDAMPNVPVESADTAAAVAASAEEGNPLLINRVLDGEFDTDSGVELIGRLARRDQPPKLMLISNYAYARQAAIDAGALPGFGKAAIYQPAVTQHLRQIAAHSDDSSSSIK